MKLATRGELYRLLLLASTFYGVDVARNDLVFCFGRHQYVLKLSACFGSEDIKRHGRHKAQFAVRIAIKTCLLDGINATCLVAACVQVVQILNEAMLRERYCQRIHGMMSMVVAFGPIFYTFYLSPVMILERFG